MLIEKFLITADHGWILRGVRFYRGAIQEEDERAGARILLSTLAGRHEWIGLRYPALRIGVQLLPHGENNASIQQIRQLSTALAEQDESFNKLRTKIHTAPDAGDADRVRDYAQKIDIPQLQKEYLQLAEAIDHVFQSRPLTQLLTQNAKLFKGVPWLSDRLRAARNSYDSDPGTEYHFSVSARLLADLREALPRIDKATDRLRLLDLSIAAEVAHFQAGAQLRAQLGTASRQQRITWLQEAVLAAYGVGYINKTSLQALQDSLDRLSHDAMPLTTYTHELNYLARTPGWATATLRFQFQESMLKLAEIEPLAHMFIQDVLRGSPLLLFAQILDSLSRDSNRLSGVSQRLFGQSVGIGVHALNPGLARGRLHVRSNPDDLENLDPQGIYLLSETTSNLPKVAGIITAGAGNPLSHVQLLARNLGIPNISIDANLIESLRAHDGETVVMAVSPGGLVELNSDSEDWRQFFQTKTAQKNIEIRPNLEKLDLSVREFIDLGALRASNSGRIVGPKAAKLGELYHHYPDKVAKAIAIPFGLFRERVLDQPYRQTGQTVFQWMLGQYRFIHALQPGSETRKFLSETLRAELHQLIINTDPGEQFRNALSAAMKKTFGTTETGVFIRSDTNIEDLPGFSGAGLNLTLFNVVGLDNILKGISLVWASPFSARAFAWRQALMANPEHVYPAILLMQSVNNDKSGVLVTEDLDSGDRNFISVAVNEGVGGAVDGQSAESLRIDLRDGSVCILATASAPWRKTLSAEGGIIKLPVSGSERILTDAEIRQLIAFAKALPETFPPLSNDRGATVAADVEFGFYQGQLRLFQIRPFLNNHRARNSAYLHNMDKALRDHAAGLVNMNETPES